MIKANTVTFEQVEPSFRKWANYFHNKHPKEFEFWELINSAWADGTVRFLPQSKIKLASGRVRWDMIDYMRRKSNNRVKQRRIQGGKSFPYFHNFSDITPKLCEEDGHGLETALECESVDIEQKDLVHYLTSHPSLSRVESLIMKLTYTENLSRLDVGRACGLAESRISQIHTNIMARLRCLDYSKITG